MWERETAALASAARGGGARRAHGRRLDGGGARRPTCVVLNYDILDAHAERLGERGAARAGLRRVALREEPARRRHQGGAGAGRASSRADALRLALTGTPILNRPEELVAQLRVLGRLRDFGSGARLTRRFRAAGSDDRLHWNLRAHCYVRRTKEQVLPQLPSKRHDTVPVLLVERARVPAGGARRGRLAPDAAARPRLDRREGRGRAARGAARAAQQPAPARRHAASCPTALGWIGDFLGPRASRWWCSPSTWRSSSAVLERFPDALHILGSDTGRKRQEAVDAFQEEDGPQLIVCSLQGGVAGHHAHARLERRVPRARLDAGPPRPGGGPPPPDRPGGAP